MINTSIGAMETKQRVSFHKQNGVIFACFIGSEAEKAHICYFENKGFASMTNNVAAEPYTTNNAHEKLLNELIGMGFEIEVRQYNDLTDNQIHESIKLQSEDNRWLGKRETIIDKVRKYGSYSFFCFSTMEIKRFSPI